MIKFYRLFSLLIIAVFCMAMFQSCGKYEEGPDFSLLTKKSRLVNTWKIEKVFHGGNDITQDFLDAYSDYTLEVKKDGTYTISYTIVFTGTKQTEAGTWQFLEKKGKIQFIPPTSSGNVYETTILRLKNSELWMTRIQSSQTDEYRFIVK